MSNKRSLQQGIGLLEIVIASSIILVGILALLVAYNTYVQYAMANSGNVQATYLAEEGLEVMTFMRDRGWTTNISRLSTTTIYYLNFSGTSWATSTTPSMIDGLFMRKITLEDVRRDTNHLIVTTGGSYDPNTKKITATIEHRFNKSTTTKSISTFITNLNAD